MELLQFHYSHYNEKARWALDWKRLPHRRRSLLPGPHALRVLRSTGATEVPVVRFGREIVAGSARILEELERRVPEPPLLPEDPELRRRALALQTHFDEEVGPPVRLALFAVMLRTPGYVARMFSLRRSAGVRALYRASLPLVSRAMARSMGITGPAAVAEAVEATRRALDRVAAEAGPDGFLVGDRFGVADLTAASLLAPVCDPPGSPMERPKPLPEPMAEYLARFAAHPGVAWVHETYRRHRPPSAAVSERG